jgi:hypothetical protein
MIEVTPADIQLAKGNPDDPVRANRDRQETAVRCR